MSSRKNSLKVAIFSTSFVFSVALLYYIFSNPLSSEKSTLYLCLLLLFAVCVNLGLDILRNFVNFSQKGWVFYLVQWILTFIVPIALIVLIEHPLQKRIMANVSKEMTPALNFIQNYQKKSGTLPESLDGFVKKEGNLKLRYYKRDKFYILVADIFPDNSDKETVYFSSQDNRWYRFHNDQYEYYKDKKIVPPNLKSYLWFIKR
jgi:hypothetical protein